MTRDEFDQLKIGEKVVSNLKFDNTTRPGVSYASGTVFTVTSKTDDGFIRTTEFPESGTTYSLFNLWNTDIKHVTSNVNCSNHVKGSTPLMGWWICKCCGENLEKWGL